MPTVLEATGVEYPVTYQGREVHPLDGRSWIPLLEDGPDDVFADSEMGFELYGFRAYRRGPWKILRLADTQPDKLAELAEAWEDWAMKYGVVEPDRPVGYAKPPRPGSH